MIFPTTNIQRDRFDARKRYGTCALIYNLCATGLSSTGLLYVSLYAYKQYVSIEQSGVMLSESVIEDACKQ
eukprot:scaffold2642_cov183-Ochromonas_danica.AAC.20